MFAKYIEYYIIVLRGEGVSSWTHCIYAVNLYDLGLQVELRIEKIAVYDFF